MDLSSSLPWIRCYHLHKSLPLHPFTHNFIHHRSAKWRIKLLMCDTDSYFYNLSLFVLINVALRYALHWSATVVFETCHQYKSQENNSYISCQINCIIILT